MSEYWLDAGTLSKPELESGNQFAPNFGADGLITAIAQDVASGKVLMIAHMNAQALELTINTGIAHYWSRSRNKLWKKGETSGELQKIRRILVDCDQDAILLEVDVSGMGTACHTGRESCFYRKVESNGGRASLRTVDSNQKFDPAKVYPAK